MKSERKYELTLQKALKYNLHRKARRDFNNKITCSLPEKVRSDHYICLLSELDKTHLPVVRARQDTPACCQS